MNSERHPTDAEYQAYDGMHCHSLWQSLPEEWRCPSCRRNKREILQWGERKGSNAAEYGQVGWKAGLHLHHDHALDFFGKQGRFPETIICGACNTADARQESVWRSSVVFVFARRVTVVYQR